LTLEAQIIQIGRPVGVQLLAARRMMQRHATITYPLQTLAIGVFSIQTKKPSAAVATLSSVIDKM
jgi:hypothetical protein